MLAVTRLLWFAALWIGVISIAAALWLEFHRDERRRRLVKNIQSVLSGQDVQAPAETRLDRAA
jgi:hypothetical protein